MVIILEGQEELTQAIADKFATAQWGTDGTLENVTDTGLISPVSGTDNAVTKQIINNTIQVVHNTGALEGDGNTFREYTVKTSSKNVNRKTTVELAKTDKKRVIATTNFYTSYN